MPNAPAMLGWAPALAADEEGEAAMGIFAARGDAN
jgi:hypothetical protein